MEVSARQLRHFVAIVDHGGVSAAARRLDMTQSSLSASLQNLEDELGFVLLVRTSKRFALTPEGEEFLEVARPVVESLEEVDGVIDETIKGGVGELRLALSPGMGAPPLPGLLSRLLRIAPTARIELVRCARNDTAVDMLRGGGAEVALVSGSSTPPDLVGVAVGEHRLQLVVPTRWRVGRAEGDLQRLGPFPFIDGCAETSTAEALRSLQRRGAQPQIVVRNTPLSAVLPLVEDGIGAAFVPEHLARDADGAGRVRIVELTKQPSLPLMLLRRPGSLSPTARLLLVVAQDPE